MPSSILLPCIRMSPLWQKPGEMRGPLYTGDGFSSRAEDAVLQGCLPVVIMDSVEPTFSNILDWSAFSIRIAEVSAPESKPALCVA